MAGMVSRATEWSLRKVLRRQDVEKIDDHADRTSAAYVGGWVSIVGNLALFSLKLALGYVTGSVAIVTDSIHSLSDVLTSGVVIAGFRLASTPADEEHPFGHGRLETIASMVVSMLLIVAGLRLFYSSLIRLASPSGAPEIESGIGVILAILAAAVVKEFMAAFSMDIARRIRSGALEADGWHHRSDAISSVLVAAALVGAMYGVYWIDSLAGILVSGFIIHAGIRTLTGSLGDVMGRQPTSEEHGLLSESASAVSGVEGVHDIVVHDYGRMKRVSLHIEVSPGHSVVDAHRIAESVENELERLGGLSVVVHVDPSSEDQFTR